MKFALTLFLAFPLFVLASTAAPGQAEDGNSARCQRVKAEARKSCAGQRGEGSHELCVSIRMAAENCEYEGSRN